VTLPLWYVIVWSMPTLRLRDQAGSLPLNGRA
jgi:hypothetical protein